MDKTMLEEKKKVIKFIEVFPIVMVLIVSLSLIFISIIGIRDYFENKTKESVHQIETKNSYEATKNVKAFKMVIGELERSVISSFKRELKTATRIGSIILQNNHYPLDDRIKILKNLKYNKHNFYFLFDTKGNNFLCPFEKLAHKNRMHYIDKNGKRVFSDFLKIINTTGEGLYEWYGGDGERKLGYIKFVRPNFILGSALNYQSIQKEIKKRALHLMSIIGSIKIKSDVIVVDRDLNVVYFKDITTKELFEKNKHLFSHSDEIIKLKIKDKLFVFNYDKYSNIYLGVVVHLDKLNAIIKQKQKETSQVLEQVLYSFLTISFVFVIIGMLLTFYLTKIVKGVFHSYEDKLIKQKERAQKLAKVKSEFLANMSHEIRTPLNAMFGFIHILQEKECDEESKKYLNIIEKSGENLLTIINDILDFSKLEAEKFQIEYIEFNPKEEIEVIHQLFASKASEKGILLKIEETNLKYNLISDPTRIKQVIANLLSNAIKFTPSNKTITLKVEYKQQNSELFVSVEDEGIGIPKDKLGHIFEAFSQADSSTTRKYGGTGLGLTISHRLVELMGGELKVESEVDKGSKFYFSIPVKEGGVITKKVQIHTDTKNKKYNYHILLVEDNKANQMFMKVILKKLGITFDIANDGVEAVELFTKNAYDIVLMDENMPNMNGIEATKKIREYERANNLSHTTIVALTANALEGDKDRFILAGMDYYLSKPLDIDKLKDIFDKG